MEQPSLCQSRAGQFYYLRRVLIFDNRALKFLGWMAFEYHGMSLLNRGQFCALQQVETCQKLAFFELVYYNKMTIFLVVLSDVNILFQLLG